MLLASLLDSGLVEHEAFTRAIDSIALPHGSFNLKIEKTERSHISALRVDVQCQEADTERHLSEINEIIERSAISNSAKGLAKSIFRRLAEAESQVHNIDIESVHFHEVGAIDSIVDLIGFAIAYDMAGISKSHVSAIPLGSGFAKTMHGTLPVPAPATLKLVTASQAKISQNSIPFECLTPTGAAILCEIASSWGESVAFEKILASGSGAGTKDPHDWPNICRVLIGESASGKLSKRFSEETVSVVEANIDDQSPQGISYAIDQLWKNGALDVSVTPCVMKKGRSGHLLSVICAPERALAIQELVLIHTSTLGARVQSMTRLVANRQLVEVDMHPSIVRIKIATDNRGQILNVQPEFDDLANFANANNLSIKEAHQQVMNRYEETQRQP